MTGRRVRFAVVCPTARPGEHVRVVGQPESMGAWAPERSEVALSTSPSEFPLWRSEWVVLPEVAKGWEYKYVLCGPRGARWEGGKNRLLSAGAVPAAATVREVFDSCEPPRISASSEGPPPTSIAPVVEAEVLKSGGPAAPPRAPAAGELRVRFKVKCRAVKPGQEMRVVGSIGALGDWSPHSPSAVQLQTSAADFPAWRSDWISVPLGHSGFEYKYVITGHRGSAQWEHGANRRIPAVALEVQPGASHLTLTAEFDVAGTGCSLEAPAEAPAAPKPRPPSPPPLPELSKEVQSSLPSRKNMPRNPASFCTLMQAIERENGSGPKAVMGSRFLQRRATIGCIGELPEGLVPTKRSLGLQPANGDLDLVREAACSEYVDQKDTIMERNLSFEATSDLTDSTDASRMDQSSTTSQSPQVQTSGVDSQNSFCISEPEAELAQPKSFEDCYSLSIKVGEGAFGVVYRCTPRVGGPDLAVKVVNKDRLTHYALVSLVGDEASGKEGEISLHKSLPPHKNVVGIHDCFHEVHCVRLVMDMCRGGDLFDAILRAKARNKAKCKDAALSETAAGSVVRQILSAIEFCHRHGIVHRDVKAENVLLVFPEDEVPLEHSGAVVKLCDFGLSARCWASAGSVLRDPVGSPDYVAPEVARQEAYGQPVDVWSAGVLLFASLRGRLPFPARTDHEALVLVRQGKVTYDDGWKRVVSREARTCTEHLLRVTPSERPTAEKAQQHAFFAAVAPADMMTEMARGG